MDCLHECHRRSRLRSPANTARPEIANLKKCQENFRKTSVADDVRICIKEVEPCAPGVEDERGAKRWKRLEAEHYEVPSRIPGRRIPI